MERKELFPCILEQLLPINWVLRLSVIVGKSIYLKNRRYNLSYGRYILKIADIHFMYYRFFKLYDYSVTTEAMNGKLRYFSAQSIPYPTMNSSGIWKPTYSAVKSTLRRSGLSSNVQNLSAFGLCIKK